MVSDLAQTDAAVPVRVRGNQIGKKIGDGEGSHLIRCKQSENGPPGLMAQGRSDFTRASTLSAPPHFAPPGP